MCESMAKFVTHSSKLIVATMRITKDSLLHADCIVCLKWDLYALKTVQNWRSIQNTMDLAKTKDLSRMLRLLINNTCTYHRQFFHCF